MSKQPLGKTLLRNVIRHTDAHNKVCETGNMLYSVGHLAPGNEGVMWSFLWSISRLFIFLIDLELERSVVRLLLSLLILIIVDQVVYVL